jgi:Zn-dependent protease
MRRLALQQDSPVLSVVLLFVSWQMAQLWGSAAKLPGVEPLTWLLLGPAVHFFAVLSHECGHVIGAWSSGMKLAKFQIGPLQWVRRSEGWTFKFLLLGLFLGGGRIATDAIYEKNLSSRLAVELAAGPLTSFAVACTAFMYLLMAPGSSWVDWWPAPAWLSALSLTQLALNLLPFEAMRGFSDTAAMLQQFRGGAGAKVELAAKLSGIPSVSMLRPRELNPEPLETGATAAVGAPEESRLKQMQMICAIDRSDLIVARQKLEQVLRLISNPSKAADPLHASEICFYMTYLDGHSRRSSHWLAATEELAKKAKFQLADSWDYWRAVAAVRSAEGDSTNADLAWARARKFGDILPKTGLLQLERELLQAVYKGDWLYRQELLALQTSLNHEVPPPPPPEPPKKVVPPSAKAAAMNFRRR